MHGCGFFVTFENLSTLVSIFCIGKAELLFWFVLISFFFGLFIRKDRSDPIDFSLFSSISVCVFLVAGWFDFALVSMLSVESISKIQFFKLCNIVSVLPLVGRQGGL